MRALGGALVSVSLLWDMAGFYDTIQPGRLLLDALGRGFPPQVLLLESLLHLAPRVLRDRDKSCSLPIHPERSIVAGVRGAVDMARCYLYSILEDAHARFFPRGVSTRSWVDDIVQRTTGLASGVVPLLVEAGSSLASAARARDLDMSGKPTVCGACPQAVDAVVAGLKAAGLDLKPAKLAPDLGIDRGQLGGRRLGPKARNRWSGAQRRWRKAAALSKAAGLRSVGRMLMLSGSHAKARYSGAVHGTPPSRVASLRRALGSVTTAHAAGRCLTTALACDVGSKDPAISCVFDVVNNWFSILNAGPLERARALGSWAITVAKLRAAGRRRWSQLHGPMGAVIAVLLDLSWVPKGPWTWESDLGVTFDMPNEAWGNPSGQDWSDLRHALRGAIDRRLWWRASRHHLGGGLEGGVDSVSLRRLRR